MPVANGPKVTRENLGAWMVKCNPKVWDLAGYLDDGGRTIDDWSVQENYRSELMAPGDLVFFWVTGPADAQLTPGVWGVGHVVAPSDWFVGVADADPTDDGYWLDHEARLQASYFARLEVPLLDAPVPRTQIAADPDLARLEVISSPQMGNPQYVSTQEADALLKLVGGAPEIPEPEPSEIVVDEHGASFGDPLKNRLVELAAMDVVTEHLGATGWSWIDVSVDEFGWDVSARKGKSERHVEVKGVSGREPIVLLTRNEYEKASSDHNWCLMVVTQALSKQIVHEYTAAEAVAACEPYVYRSALPGQPVG